MRNEPRRPGSSFYEAWGNALKYRMGGWGWRAEESFPLSMRHFVAPSTGYSWRVALPQSPLPLHRLRKSVKRRDGRVKKKVAISGLTGSMRTTKLWPRIEKRPALRGTNAA
jgi:hypothetical protein